MEPEIYTEIKIFPDRDYGYSVEDYQKDIGTEGITLESFGWRNGMKSEVNRICMDRKSAILIADSIYKLLEA